MGFIHRKQLAGLSNTQFDFMVNDNHVDNNLKETLVFIYFGLC